MTDQEAFEMWWKSDKNYATEDEDLKPVVEAGFHLGLKLASIRMNSHRWAEDTWRKIYEEKTKESEELDGEQTVTGST